MSNYRVTFMPNGLTPFTWKCENFQQAVLYADKLAMFDLGKYYPNPENIKEAGIQRMIAAYKEYRRNYGINHPDLIQYSICTIDRKIADNWWICSEDLETEDEQPYIEAFDNECFGGDNLDSENFM